MNWTELNWTTPSLILNQFAVPCAVLTVVSWPSYRFLRRQVRWSGIPFSNNIPQFVVIHTVNGFSVITKAEVDGFLDFLCYLYDPVDIGNLISGSSAFLKSSLYIWMFSVPVLLKPRILSINLLTYEMRAIVQVVWTFFGIALLGDWNEKLTFSSPMAEFSKFADILSTGF